MCRRVNGYFLAEWINTALHLMGFNYEYTLIILEAHQVLLQWNITFDCLLDNCNQKYIFISLISDGRKLVYSNRVWYVLRSDMICEMDFRMPGLILGLKLCYSSFAGLLGPDGYYCTCAQSALLYIFVILPFSLQCPWTGFFEICPSCCHGNGREMMCNFVFWEQQQKLRVRVWTVKYLIRKMLRWTHKYTSKTITL